MKVLVIGGGGREHAIIWKLAQSKRVEQIFCAPGNPGIKNLAECVDIKIDDIRGLSQFAKDNNIDLTVVGAEQSLSLGIVDFFKKNDQLIFGPTQAAAKIETSKSYAKRLMHKLKIPTAAFGIFDKEPLALDHARKSKYPLVIKYDGLANARGVFICETFDQAKKAIQKGFENLYKTIVIEEFISGREVSFHVITDGFHAVPLSSSKNYKKLFDCNGGPTTPGMGAYAPVNFVDFKLEEKIAQKIIFPLLDGLNNEGTPFCGVIAAELIINDKNEPLVVEFNARFNDPDAQTILPLLENDLFDIMFSAATGAFSDEYEFFDFNDSSTVTVMLTAGGYPDHYKRGTVIEGTETIDDDNLLVFHTGTAKNKYSELVTSEGRVMSLTSVASTLNRAYDSVYDSINLIKFKDMSYRKDIAKAMVDEKLFL